MKLFRRAKIWIFTAAAIFTLAAPAYSWTHDDNFAPIHRNSYHRHHVDGGYYTQRHHYSVPSYAHHPRYIHESYGPDVRIGIPFGFHLPGVSIYVGP